MPEPLHDISKLTTGAAIRRSRTILGQKRDIASISSIIKKISRRSAEKENLILFLRRHWINLFGQLFPFAAIIVLLFVIFLLFDYFIGFDLISDLEMQMLRFAIALFALFLWSFVFIVFIDYYLDIWIVTEQRIVDIQQKGLFRREISELRLEKVQDLTTEITGIIPTFFDYGDLYVQTAGKRERFLFKSIPHPERVRDVILVLSEEEGKI
ncbi:MAG: PH domain-containing protein [Candidatus Moranbacteria bacterium]|nr:PH domain-containing protein [Candidatus Moranbacteria bacterium]